MVEHDCRGIVLIDDGYASTQIPVSCCGRANTIRLRKFCSPLHHGKIASRNRHLLQLEPDGNLGDIEMKCIL